jgi:hypothetical protein
MAPALLTGAPSKGVLMAKRDTDQPGTQPGDRDREMNDRNDEFSGTGADDMRGIADDESDEFEEEDEEGELEDLDEEEEQE